MSIDDLEIENPPYASLCGKLWKCFLDADFLYYSQIKEAQNFLELLEGFGYPSPRGCVVPRDTIQFDYNFKDGRYFEVEIFRDKNVVLFVNSDGSLNKNFDNASVLEIIKELKRFLNE